MNMRILKSVAAVLLAIAAVGCAKVEQGYVGVKYDLYGGDKASEGTVVGPGKYYLGWNEEMYRLPTFTQNSVWTKDSREGSPGDDSVTFQDKEGTQINADIGVSFAVIPEKAGAVFQKYRRGLEEITDVYVRNMIRDALNNVTSKMDVSEIYGPQKEAIMVTVTAEVNKLIEPVGIRVEKVYWIGALRLPESITSAINKKQEATQKAQQRENELQTAKAQAEIDREKARGEADALIIAAEGRAKSNKLLASSVTPELIEYTKAQRWDGKMPQVTGSNTPMIKLD